MSRLGQATVFRAAVVFKVSPKRGNPTFLLHAVESGKERAWLDGKCAVNGLLDSTRDAQSVRLASDRRLQDRHVQSLFEECCRFRVQDLSPIDALYE